MCLINMGPVILTLIIGQRGPGQLQTTQSEAIETFNTRDPPHKGRVNIVNTQKNFDKKIIRNFHE